MPFPPKARRYNDPSAPAFDADQCEFHCATPDCGEASHEADDLKKCETCGLRHCASHTVACEGLFNCVDCFKCEICGKDACGLCDSCGDFACALHLKERCMYDRDTGYSETSDVCRRCAA